MTIKISLIIPAYNEALRLPSYLSDCKKYLTQHFPEQYEILVVDDGSSDDTVKVASAIIGDAGVLRQVPNQGKGAAVKRGMLAAKGSLRLFADADGATPIAEEVHLRQKISQGYDVAIGSRAAVSAERKVDWQVKWHRHLIGRTFSLLVSAISGLRFRDTQCGFKMFSARAAEEVFGRAQMNGFVMDVELLFLTRKLGFKTAEIPVNWQEVKGSKVNLVRDSLKMLGGLFEIRWIHCRTDFALTKKNLAP